MARILVVDDEIGIRELLSEILYDEGHTVELAENAAQARESRLRQRPDLVLLDIWMPDIDGVSLLKEWSSQGLLNMPVIMMSGHATVDTAVEATRIGAVDFLEKPITLQKLLKAVAAGLARPVIPASMRSRTERPAAAADPVFTQPPAQLGSRSLSFTGLRGISVVTVPLADGSRIPVLRISADSITIQGFSLTVRKQTGSSLATTGSGTGLIFLGLRMV